MNNPFDYIPSRECLDAFVSLVAKIEGLRESSRMEDVCLCRELDAGKMLGVLVARDGDGERHILYAFSGQIGDAGFHHKLFVEPVFDYLDPDGYFKRREGYISGLNMEISRVESEELISASERYEKAKRSLDEEVERLRREYRISKAEREAKRLCGMVDEMEMAAMIRQSQYEKAELKRLKRRVAAELQPFANSLSGVRKRLEEMKQHRRAESEALQDWLFGNMRLLNGRGEWMSVGEIFSSGGFGIPPSGSGECCAPKLLHAAYLRGWQPLSMAEFWYGRAKGGEVRSHGEFYPACRGKCMPLLHWMLQGLEVVPPLGEDSSGVEIVEPKLIFENEWFCVVDKPSGMLSVPGRVDAMSVEDWLRARYGADREVRMAHRLDRDTSGLIIATFGADAYRAMQRTFAGREVRKRYVALLAGDWRERGLSRCGIIDLPLSADWYYRPRQRVDFEGGKKSETEYEFVDVKDGRSRVVFHPLTGRTHQLRVHSALENGLGMPISGDALYGRDGGLDAERLCLHASRVEFTFPLDGKRYVFEVDAPF